MNQFCGGLVRKKLLAECTGRLLERAHTWGRDMAKSQEMHRSNLSHRVPSQNMQERSRCIISLTMPADKVSVSLLRKCWRRLVCNLL